MKQDPQERRYVRIKPHAGIVLVVVLIAALLAYVGVTHGLAGQTAAPSTSPSQPHPTSVHVVRIPGNTPTFKIEPLDRTITDVSQV